MTEPRESRRPGPSTVAVHGAPAAPRPVDASVVGPVHRSTTFPLDERGLADVEATGGAGTWYYGRLRNPTNARVAAAVAALEGAPAGEIFASGMAAIGTTLTALVPPGGRLVAAAELYGDTRALLEGEWAAAGRRVTYVDVADLDGFARALAGGADALLVEALSNPMLRVADLPRLAALAREHGALAIVDATFASPVNVRPYEHGFDAVVHSATKYLNGHTDLVAGAVAGSEEVVARLRPHAALRGATLDPGGAYLLERGLKTLAVRMDRHNANGLAVARALRAHPDVARRLPVPRRASRRGARPAAARGRLGDGHDHVAGDPGRGRRSRRAAPHRPRDEPRRGREHRLPARRDVPRGRRRGRAAAPGHRGEHRAPVARDRGRRRPRRARGRAPPQRGRSRARAALPGEALRSASRARRWRQRAGGRESRSGQAGDRGRPGEGLPARSRSARARRAPGAGREEVGELGGDEPCDDVAAAGRRAARDGAGRPAGGGADRRPRVGAAGSENLVCVAARGPPQARPAHRARRGAGSAVRHTACQG